MTFTYLTPSGETVQRAIPMPAGHNYTLVPSVHCTHHDRGPEDGHACLMLADGRHGGFRYVQYHNSTDFYYTLYGFGASGSDAGHATFRGPHDLSEQRIIDELAGSPGYRRAFEANCEEHERRGGWKPAYVGNVTFKD